MRAEADEASIEYEATGAGRLAPPLVLGQLMREWAFSELRGDSLEEVGLEHGIQVGGLVHQLHDFGPTFRDSDVFFPDGSSLPSTSSPPARSLRSPTASPIGSALRLRRASPAFRRIRSVAARSCAETQSFIKRAPDASLSFRLSTAFIETTDLNAVLGRRCPPVHADGLFCDLVKGDLFLMVSGLYRPGGARHHPVQYLLSRGRAGHGERVRRERVAGHGERFAENWNSDAGLEPADVADLDTRPRPPSSPRPARRVRRRMRAACSSAPRATASASPTPHRRSG